VSTNSAEGLFGRLKSYFRARGAKKVPKHNYGKLLAEFFWRQYVSAHDLDPFADLLVRVQEWQKGNPNYTEFERCLSENIPRDIVQDFESVKEVTMWTEEPDIPRQHSSPPQPHAQQVEEEMEEENLFGDGIDSPRHSLPSSQLLPLLPNPRERHPPAPGLLLPSQQKIAAAR